MTNGIETTITLLKESGKSLPSVHIPLKNNTMVKEIIILCILAIIALLLGWIYNMVEEIRDNRLKENENLSVLISKTMRDEFTYDRQAYKFVIEK